MLTITEQIEKLAELLHVTAAAQAEMLLEDARERIHVNSDGMIDLAKLAPLLDLVVVGHAGEMYPNSPMHPTKWVLTPAPAGSFIVDRATCRALLSAQVIKVDGETVTSMSGNTYTMEALNPYATLFVAEEMVYAAQDFAHSPASYCAGEAVEDYWTWTEWDKGACFLVVGIRHRQTQRMANRYYYPWNQHTKL